MNTQSIRISLMAIVLILIISPLGYFASDIGQRAESLTAEPEVVAAGVWQNSPKAEALHALTLPIRVEKLILYPALLLLLQFSGLATGSRKRIEVWVSAHISSRRYWRSIATAAIFIAAISTLIMLIFLPFSLYGLTLRHQFGLSTQSFPAWLRDFGVSWGIGLLTDVALYGGFFALVNLFPKKWHLLAGAGFLIVSVAYILLEPILITPLFYTVTPVTDPDLRGRITAMADRAGIEIDDISIIDASKRTTAVNAYFTGIGGASKIVLWDTLLENHPPDEVDMVIAHEMGHWVHHHILWYVLGAGAAVWLGMFALRWWLNRVWRRLGWRSPGDVAAYPYLLALVAIVSALTLPIANGISRTAESQADEFALAVGQKPDAAARMFERFAVENVSLMTVPAWEKFIFYTHPPLGERIEKAEEFTAGQPNFSP